MTGDEIIAKFEEYVDDGTELSSQEELDLANKIYNKVCNYRPWNFLKAGASGSISGSSITLPTDFACLVNNYEETGPKTIYLGSVLNPYKIVNWSDRRQYSNQSVAYIDPTDSTIKFTFTPTETTYEFDYIKIPTALTTSTSPAFPARFHDIIYHGMAVDDYAIQQFDKARSYAPENQAKFDSILKDMSFWDAQFYINN